MAAEDAPALAMRAMSKATADVELFRSCFVKNGSPRTRETVDWQYVANPTGELFVDFALAQNDRLAAIYASLPIRIRIGNEVGLAVQSVDTITDEDFRGRGLFVKLAKTTYARAAASGAKLVYGFPNGSSAHGFFQRLDWRDLDPVPFLIRPLRTRYVAERFRLPRFVPDLPLYFGRGRFPAEPIARFDDRATALWHRFAAQIGVAVERDARYLDWRLAKPGEDYTSAAAVAGGDYVALASHAVKDKHGGRIGYVMESLCAPGHARELRGLLGNALADMRRRGADVALAWCLPHSPTYRSFLRMGFLPFPEKYRPIELHFGARSFDARHDAVVHDRRSWYLSYLDSDTV
jgi:hypothetical protein